MKKNFFNVFFVSLFFYPNVFAQSDPCSTLADLQSKSANSKFVGFGAGASQQEADQNAQIDLARGIRQQVSATSSVSGSNTDLSLKTYSHSIVSELLINSNVLKRCNISSDHFSTVVTLDKKIFLSSLEEKIASILKKSVALKKSLETSETEEQQAENIDAAKKFLISYESSFENDFELCRVYKGCTDIKDDGVFSKIHEIILKIGDKDQYFLVSPNNAISRDFQGEVISILEEDGIKITTETVAGNKANKPRTVYLNCKSKVGTFIPGTKDRVLEVRCQVEAFLGKTKKFNRNYVCKSLMDNGMNLEDAVNVCSGRLALEN